MSYICNSDSSDSGSSTLPVSVTVPEPVPVHAAACAAIAQESLSTAPSGVHKAGTAVDLFNGQSGGTCVGACYWAVVVGGC